MKFITRRKIIINQFMKSFLLPERYPRLNTGNKAIQTTNHNTIKFGNNFKLLTLRGKEFLGTRRAKIRVNKHALKKLTIIRNN